MSDPLVEWRKVWFFLWNNTDMSVPVFMSSRPIPQPKWRYGVAQTDLRRLQPLWEMTMWIYLGPSCPDRPFSVGLGDDLNHGSDPIPLRVGVDNPWVSLLGPAFGYLCQSPFLNLNMFLCRVSCTLAASDRGSP
jgi:hypothetical protein